jgi:hypothetical protein
MTRLVAIAMGLMIPVVAAYAQPTEDTNAPTEAEMVSLIGSYPKELWEPMLELASHPLVLDRLAKNEPADVTGRIQNEAVKQAAAVLAKEPEAAKALADDRAGAMVIGKAYSADKEKVLVEVAKEAEIEENATDEWSKQLSADGDAINQLTAALKAYQNQQGAALSAEDAAAEAGVNMSGGTTIVNALPSPSFATYVLNNADIYPALSDVMVSQWLGHRNSWAYDHTFRQWWDHFHNAFHDEHFFHNDEHRADRLADAARYDRKFASEDHRWDHFNDHRTEYQHLGKVNPPPKDHEVEHDRKPQVHGAGEHHVQHKPEAGLHPGVHRGHASFHEHTHHAAVSHHHVASHRSK